MRFTSPSTAATDGPFRTIVQVAGATYENPSPFTVCVFADVEPPQPARMRSGTTPRNRKERRLMGRQKDTLLTKADTVRPYVERAMTDENLRRDVLRAFAIARGLYGELARDRDAIEDLRSASERLQGKRQRSGIRGSTLLVTGIALGILFNPVTGPETRRFIKDMFSGGGGHHDHDHHGANGR